VKRPAAASLIACLTLAASGSACTDVAEGRARRDARIGQASAPGIVVHVHEGLATVTDFDPVVHLWLQAPDVGFDVDLAAGAGPIEVLASNALSDAELVVLAASVAVTIEPIISAAGSPVTDRRWLVTPSAVPARLSLRIAPPDADTDVPWRFGVFADVQSAIDRVQDIYQRMAADPSLRFVVMSGDLTETGSDAELRRFKDNMAGLPIPIYATLGNHELGTRDDLFHDHFGRGNFSFVFRGVQFTLLDTASATVAPVVYDWLEDWLLAGLDRAHFVFAHIPPLDPAGTRNGAFASRLEANKLLSLLASGKVDCTFYGHIHSYYAYSNAGMPAYISGGGGAIPQRLDGIGRHYLTVDITPGSQLFQVGMVRVPD
jgi:hypothetical protein